MNSNARDAVIATSVAAVVIAAMIVTGSAEVLILLFFMGLVWLVLE